MLNIVVLPAPFGPMMAVTSPDASRSDTCDTAMSPPNCIVMPSVTSAGPFEVMAR